MKRNEIKQAVLEAIESLRLSRIPAPSEVRQKHRNKANEIMATLPENWWRKLPDSESDALAELLGKYA